MTFGVYASDNKDFYLIPIIFIYVVLAVVIWFDLRRINIVAIDPGSKKIQIASSSPIQRWLLKYVFRSRTDYDFHDIIGFMTEENSPSKADSRKYFIRARLKDGDNKLLFSLRRKEQANTIAIYLSELTKP